MAPNRVNYHLEHHLLMTVPHYNLPLFHEKLKEKGLIDRCLITHGYWQVLADASARPA